MKRKVDRQKGITLVALIITIIVMIILVAVTLNIALGENGLIAKAKETRAKQEEQTIYEDIQGMMELNNNGEIEVDKTVDNVKAKYPGTELSGTTLTVPGKYETYKYKLTITEIEILGDETNNNKQKIFGSVYAKKDSGMTIEYYFFKSGVSLMSVKSGDSYIIHRFYNTSFVDNEVIIDGVAFAKDFAENGSSCKAKFGESWVDLERGEENYKYDYKKDDNLGIYINDAIYKNENSLIWINENEINIYYRSRNSTITISDITTETDLKNTITEAGYNMEISNEGKTITWHTESDGDIVYNLLESLD